MYQFLVLILFLFFISKYTEGYLNYEELSFQGTEKNCPQQHANNYHRLVDQTKLKDFFNNYSNQYSNCGSLLSDEYIGQCSEESENQSENKSEPNQSKSAYQMIQPFGYTKNELLHNTRFIKTDIPLPTDPDFFKHI